VLTGTDAPVESSNYLTLLSYEKCPMNEYINRQGAAVLTLLKRRIKNKQMSVKKPKQIFIVDDNEIYSMMLDYILSKDSIYKFVSFRSGGECIENLYLKPEIIILDYEMPGLNGYDTLLEIKKQDPHIHVVILTSREDELLKEKLLRAGADDYVLKQGHGETQIIERIEGILNKEGLESVNSWVVKNKLLYFVLIAILLILGFYYYK